MNLFDLVSLIVIAGFFMWGTIKGFIIEVSEIGGLIVSFVLTMYLPLSIGSGVIKYIASFLVYFFAISIFFSILSKIIHKTPLAFLDRILGGGIGAIKGIIIIIVIFLIVSLSPIKNPASNLSNSLFYKTALIVKIPIKDFLNRRIKGLDQYKERIPLPKEQEKTGKPI
jgi:uncharacterized membrane protein required for colicin V production